MFGVFFSLYNEFSCQDLAGLRKCSDEDMGTSACSTLSLHHSLFLSISISKMAFTSRFWWKGRLATLPPRLEFLKRKGKEISTCRFYWIIALEVAFFYQVQGLRSKRKGSKWKWKKNWWKIIAWKVSIGNFFPVMKYIASILLVNSLFISLNLDINLNEYKGWDSCSQNTEGIFIH